MKFILDYIIAFILAFILAFYLNEIIFEIYMLWKDGNMLKIVYARYGKPYSDFCSLRLAKKIVNNYLNDYKEKIINVSTSNIIVALRILVKRGMINYKEIIFEFEDELITIDSNGKLSHYPKGFIDWYDCFLDELLDI